MIRDRASPYYMGQKVKWVRQEVVGSEQCFACGHETEEFEDVVTQHTVIGVHTTYKADGSLEYSYELDGVGHIVNEGDIIA